MIESFQNSKLKLVRNYFENSHYRKKADFFVVENLNVILDIARNNSSLIQFVLSSSSQISEQIKTVFPNVIIYNVTISLFKEISSFKTSQGVVAVLYRKQVDPKAILDKLLKKTDCNMVLLDSVSNPSNFGAIVRNAAAYGLKAVLYTQNSVDPYHPQSIRAMAGTFFQIPFLEITHEILLLLIQKGFQFYTLVPHQGMALREAVFGAKNVFVFGSEAHGIHDPTLSEISRPIHIEMDDSVDSLNVAVSTGILFYSLETGFKEKN